MNGGWLHLIFEHRTSAAKLGRWGRFLVGFLALSLANGAGAQPFVREVAQLRDARFAEWIAPSDEAAGATVVLFRRSLPLAAVPERFIVHVSGDYAYRFYVNGNEVAWGPAASDLSRWNYETVDLAPWLQAGDNILAAQVWREAGEAFAPARQVSARLAFILQGDSPAEFAANTNRDWRVSPNTAVTPIAQRSAEVGGGYIAGATDRIDGNDYPWGWSEKDFDDSRWLPAQEIGKGNHAGLNTWLGTPWLLRARTLPPMEEQDEPVGRIVRADGVEVTLGDVLDAPVTIGPRRQATLLLDHGALTMGVPHVRLSGGEGASVRLTYQEALFDPSGRKGDRNDLRGKTMKGYYDEILTDGGTDRHYAPRWVRTFRFLEVQVATADEPLRIESIVHRFTAYSFEERGTFVSSDPTIEPIWDASWRTARMCALDTYMDCPYYEQLQYIGDTRLQALISYYVSGDSRLARQALEAFGASLQPMGLTKSSHPSGHVQIIPPFSLIYVLMLHDYWMFTEDTAFVRKQLTGARFIMEWFLARIDARNGLLGPLPYWNHVDGGVREFDIGSPPGAVTGGSAHLSLLLALALDRLGEMVEPQGRPGDVEFYRGAASRLKAAVRAHCWDPSRGLFVETPGGTLVTMHTNSLAILADATPVAPAQVARRMLAEERVVQPTLYFEFYVFEALAAAGLGDEILARLDRWKAFLDQGLSTFPEHGVESRSDCHAWSAHPLHGLLAITAGVRSASPGFSDVLVAPNPGELQEFNASIPHPRGDITVAFRRNASIEQYTINLPHGVGGRFKRGTIEQTLIGGRTEIQVPVASVDDE